MNSLLKIQELETIFSFSLIKNMYVSLENSYF